MPSPAMSCPICSISSLCPSFLPRYESSSEDSSTAENFSDNESTENEAPEPEERVPSVVEAPQLRPSGTAAAKTSQEECQLPRESQHVPVAEAASGANAEEEIRSVFSVRRDSDRVRWVTSASDLTIHAL